MPGAPSLINNGIVPQYSDVPARADLRKFWILVALATRGLDVVRVFRDLSRLAIGGTSSPLPRRVIYKRDVHRPNTGSDWKSGAPQQFANSEESDLTARLEIDRKASNGHTTGRRGRQPTSACQ